MWQGWLAEVEGRLPARTEQSRRQSGVYEAQNASGVNSCAQDRERYSICTGLGLPTQSLQPHCRALQPLIAISYPKELQFWLWWAVWLLGRPVSQCIFTAFNAKNEGSHLSVVTASFKQALEPLSCSSWSCSPCPKPGDQVVLSSAEVGCYSCFVFPLLSSPDGSYTEEQSQETEMKVPATDFDDEFDDEEPLPTIGTCKALYTFEGITQTLPSFHWQGFF